MAAGLEVADIFRRHGEGYRHRHDAHLGRLERRVMSAIEMCRTARLGGHVQQCEDCDTLRIAYNSCRNRHCPKCQGQASRDWLAARQADLLPVSYFHVVFTVPREIAAISFHNKAALYAILFQAVARTLRRLAANPRHLGAEIGFIAVCIPGARTYTTTRMSIASCRAADCRPISPAGLPADQNSSCLCGFCRDCSGGCFLKS